MKKLYVMFISLSLLVGTTFAQKPAEAVLNAPANYLKGLNHSNSAVVESSIFNVMLLKHYYPDLDFTKINKKLDDLAINGENKTIRLKAFISTNYIKNPQDYNWIEQETFAETMTLVNFSLKEYNASVNDLKNNQKLIAK